MLSALVQSEAAIIAIVVTLSLVVVQLTASFYSAKITKIFRESPDLWILMISYICAMVYSLLVLQMVEEIDSILNVEKQVIFSLFLGIFCFFSLLPYTYIMLIMLRISTIIGKLSEEINKNSLLKEDPVYPIIDIIIGSMKKDDFRTVRDGMGAIGNRISYVHKTEELSKEEDLMISSKLFDHIYWVCQLAVDRDDESSAEVIMKEVLEIGKVAIGEGHYVPVEKAADFFMNIGRRAAGRCRKLTTGRAIIHLGVLGRAAHKGKFEEIAKIIIEDLKTLRDAARRSHRSCLPTDAEWLEVAENATGWIERVETEIG